METSRISDTAACLGCSCANVLCRATILLSAHQHGKLRLDISVSMCMARYLGQPHTEIDNPPQASIYLASMDDDLLPTAHLICPRGPDREVTAGKARDASYV